MVDYVCRGRKQLDDAAALVSRLSPEKIWRVSICAYKARRSTEQNNRAWAIYTAIARETGYAPAEVHEICKMKFGEPKVIKVGDEEMSVYSTRDKDVQWMSDFIDRCEAWAAQEFGVALG